MTAKPDEPVTDSIGRPACSRPNEPVAQVQSRTLGFWVEPSDAFVAVQDESADVVWKDDSAAPRATAFVGWGSRRILIRSAPTARAEHPVPDRHSPASSESPVSTLDSHLRRHGFPSPWLGWWGWFGYELGAAHLGLNRPATDAPAAAFFFADRGAVFDRGRRTVTLLRLGTGSNTTRWLTKAEARFAALRTTPPARAPTANPGTVSWRHDRHSYLAMITSCQRAIERGDAYLLCLTNPITVDLDHAPDPVEVYQRLRISNAATHGGILQIAGWTLISGSPEQFLSVSPDGHASTSPIKGTRPRGRTDTEDDTVMTELQTSEKERAENVMIVDLMRNDLSRVSRAGTVAVTRLFDVETYPTVHQLVSTVESQLTSTAPIAALTLLPAGSMTGAPKRSAMSILADLESGPRGIYSGAWGRFSIDGSADLAVVIRNIVLHDNTATIGTGGAITILSNAEQEWEETLLKAKTMLDALGAHSQNPHHPEHPQGKSRADPADSPAPRRSPPSVRR